MGIYFLFFVTLTIGCSIFVIFSVLRRNLYKDLHQELHKLEGRLHTLEHPSQGK